MKKLLVTLTLVTALVVATIPAAIGYVYPDGYNFNYGYDTSSSMYGPMLTYSATRPVYRVTSAYDAQYPVSAYAYNYNYNYDYQYSYTNTMPVTGSITNTADTFIDVPLSDPNYAAIQWLGRQGIAGGFDGGRYFRPSSAITRSQFVSMVVKGRKVNPSASQYRYCYGDVSTQSYANEICYAKTVGWLPYNSTNFDPGQSISVSDIRYIIERAYGSYPYTLPNFGTMTRSDVAGVLYTAITRSGSFPATTNPPAATIYPPTSSTRLNNNDY